jgi:hypothetical protein
MRSGDLLARRDGLLDDTDEHGSYVKLTQEDGGLLVLLTGHARLRRQRRTARLVSAAGVAGGLALLAITPMGVLLTGVAAAAFILVPRAIRSRRLVEIDTRKGLLAGRDSDGSFPLDDVVATRGVYDVKGWDPRNTVYAVGRDGTETDLVFLSGRDERLTEALCRTLGVLLDTPSTYADPSGRVTVCHRPGVTA